MTLSEEIQTFLRAYPQIYFACHSRHVRDEKTRKSISRNQASILDHLDDVAPTSLHALARHMGVTASTMSLNVDRLERTGYVRRQRDGGDGRRIELRLTEAGVRIKQQQKLLEPERVGALLKELNESERSKALAGLELLANAAAEMTARWQATKQEISRGKLRRIPS